MSRTRIVCVLAGLMLGVAAANAQERNAPAVGLDGYCPVCVVKMKQWVKGSPEHEVVYDGKVYRFPGADQKQMFLADPARYVPALGGDCGVCLAKMGKRVPGSVKFGAIHKGRVWLFPGVDQRQMFLANAGQFENVDLAYGGGCAVCSVEMRKEVPGKPEFTVLHKGLRYQFPGEDQMNMFIADPARYEQKQDPAGASIVAPETTQLVSIEGRSGCAACDYGVHPIRDQGQLGLAVKSQDGKVYIVEGAHRDYKRIYDGRFEGLPLKVSGRILKESGQFVWLEPQDVSLVN